MDDDFTILAAAVPDSIPAEPAAVTLPFPPPAERRAGDETILLRGYDDPGEYFQPRLRGNDAA